jgi:hypothetical protein
MTSRGVVVSPHLNVMEAAEYLRCNVSYLNKLRFIGGGAPFKKGRRGRVLYSQLGLDKWVQSRRFTRTKYQTKLDALESSLYRHFDEDGVLLYVGIAVDPVRRLSGHRHSHWYDKIDTIRIEHCPTHEAALAAELEAIRTEKPVHNVGGKAAA